MLIQFFDIWFATGVFFFLTSLPAFAGNDEDPSAAASRLRVTGECASGLEDERQRARKKLQHERDIDNLVRARGIEDKNLLKLLLSEDNQATYQIPSELAVAIAKHRLGNWEWWQLPSRCLYTKTQRIQGVEEVRLFMTRAVDRRAPIHMAFRYSGVYSSAVLGLAGRFGATNNTAQRQLIIYGTDNLITFLHGLKQARLLTSE